MSKSLSGDVYAAIRGDIVTGRMSSGERLHLSRLASQYGVSLGVVREAVTRLASERLLESTPQIGFRVRVLSTDDLDDLTRVRIHIETLALRESIARGDVTWEAQLVAAHHALAATPFDTDDNTRSLEWLTRHAEFHAALCAACGSPWLLELRQQLFAASELYRFWFGEMQARAGSRSRLAQAVAREHKGLLDAALSRDGDLAAERITRHFEKTAQTIRADVDRNRKALQESPVPQATSG